MILKSNDASISKLSRDGHSLEQFLRLRTLRCFLIDLIKKFSTGTPKMKLGKCNFCKEKVCEVRKYYYIMNIIKTFLKALDILIVTYLNSKSCLYKAITKSESKIYVSWKNASIITPYIYLHCIFAIGLQNNICTCTTK